MVGLPLLGGERRAGRSSSAHFPSPSCTAATGTCGRPPCATRRASRRARGRSAALGARRSSRRRRRSRTTRTCSRSTTGRRAFTAPRGRPGGGAGTPVVFVVRRRRGRARREPRAVPLPLQRRREPGAAAILLAAPEPRRCVADRIWVVAADRGRPARASASARPAGGAGRTSSARSAPGSACSCSRPLCSHERVARALGRARPCPVLGPARRHERGARDGGAHTRCASPPSRSPSPPTRCCSTTTGSSRGRLRAPLGARGRARDAARADARARRGRPRRGRARPRRRGRRAARATRGCSRRSSPARSSARSTWPRRWRRAASAGRARRARRAPPWTPARPGWRWRPPSCSSRGRCGSSARRAADVRVPGRDGAGARGRLARRSSRARSSRCSAPRAPGSRRSCARSPGSCRTSTAGASPAASRSPATTRAALARPSSRARSRRVFQDPEDQVVMTRVENEVAFGLENVGTPPDEIWPRVARGARGGRRAAPRRAADATSSRAASCSASASRRRSRSRPRLLLLDEPTSQLDPDGAEALPRARRTELGAAVVCPSSAPAGARARRPRALLEGGRLLLDAPRDEALAWLAANRPGYLARLAPRRRRPTADGDVSAGSTDVVVRLPRRAAGARGVVARGPPRRGRRARGPERLRQDDAREARRRAARAASAGVGAARARRATSRRIPAATSSCERVAGRGRARASAATCGRARARARAGSTWAVERRHPRDLSSGERERLGLAAVPWPSPTCSSSTSRRAASIRSGRPSSPTLAPPTRRRERATLVATHDRGFPAHAPTVRRRSSGREPRCCLGWSRCVAGGRRARAAAWAALDPDARRRSPLLLAAVRRSSSPARLARGRAELREGARRSSRRSAALAAAGRVLFAPVPGVQPVTVIVGRGGRRARRRGAGSPSARSRRSRRTSSSARGRGRRGRCSPGGLRRSPAGCSQRLLRRRCGVRRLLLRARLRVQRADGRLALVQLLPAHVGGARRRASAAGFSFSAAHAVGNVVIALAVGPELRRVLERYGGGCRTEVVWA